MHSPTTWISLSERSGLETFYKSPHFLAEFFCLILLASSSDSSYSHISPQLSVSTPTRTCGCRSQYCEGGRPTIALTASSYQLLLGPLQKPKVQFAAIRRERAIINPQLHYTEFLGSVLCWPFNVELLLNLLTGILCVNKIVSQVDIASWERSIDKNTLSGFTT